MSDRDFQIHAELVAFEKAGDENPMRVGGIVSTDEMDEEDETVIQEGLNFNPFMERGWFNDNHSKKTTDVVGYPTESFYVRKGVTLPSGRKAKNSGWWAEGYLLNTEEGRKMWALAQSLEDTPRKLAFSIEGKVRSRHPSDSKMVTSADVYNVAITHCPVNTGTQLHTLVKAMSAGHVMDSAELSAGTPGAGGALRPESLDDELSDQDFGKSDMDFVLEPISEIEYIEGWVPAMAGMDPHPGSLTLDEARVIVKSERPNLSDAAVDRILNNAATGA